MYISINMHMSINKYKLYDKSIQNYVSPDNYRI
jgi:hypothetical protein